MSNSNPSNGNVAGNLPPGSNPNLMNAQGRKKGRSGRLNTPRPEPQRSNFIDPLPEPVVFQTEIMDTLKPGYNIVGTVELDPSQIDLAALMFANASDSVRDRLAQRIAFPAVHNMSHSMFHMAVASQMYSSLKLLNENSGAIYRFKSLNYLNLEVPKFVSSMTQNYGHFKSKEGVIQVKHLQTLMLREVAKGLAYANVDFNNFAELINIDDANNYYFDTHDFTHVLNDRCQNVIKRYSEIDFVANVNGNMIRTRLPNFDPDDKQDYHNAINAIVPQVQQPEIHAACASYGLDFAMFNEPGRVNDRNLLQLVRLPYQLAQLNNLVGEYGVNYSRSMLNTFQQMYETSPIVTCESGSAAQVVQSTNIDNVDTQSFAEHSYCISEKDAAFGFILMPSLNFEYEPRFQTFSMKNRMQLFNQFAQSSYKV